MILKEIMMSSLEMMRSIISLMTESLKRVQLLLREIIMPILMMMKDSLRLEVMT